MLHLLFGAAQTTALKISSNAQLKGFFHRQNINNTDPELLYKLSAAAFYRRQVALELQRRLGPVLAPGRELTESDVLKLQQMLLVNANLNPAPGEGEGEFSVRLETLVASPSPLGLTLTETHGGRAVVHRVAAEGIASSAGLRPGDYVIGIASDREWRFNVVLPKIAKWSAGRPSKKNTKSTRALVLTVWRPPWRPDAFMMHTVQATHDAKAALERTEAMLDAGRQAEVPPPAHTPMELLLV